MSYRYVITNAWLQLGSAAPYNCVRIPVRMVGDEAQINLSGFTGEPEWVAFPKDGPRTLPIKEWRGQPVAGISSNWDLA